MANVREDLREVGESLPERWFEAPGFKNYVTEEPLSREEAEQMIEDYFEEWGWDGRSGVPTDDRLEELRLTRDASRSGSELHP
jgi:aldehyde:ferredoxin oxidoreductase